MAHRVMGSNKKKGVTNSVSPFKKFTLVPGYALALRVQLYSMKPPFVCFAAGEVGVRKKKNAMLAMHTMSWITAASVWLHIH